MTTKAKLKQKDPAPTLAETASDLKIQVKYTYQKNKLQKPRRNKSAFILFSGEARAQIKQEEGELNSNEMMVKLAAKWKNLSISEQERYKTMAKNDKIRYQQELIEYAKLHPDETIHNKTKNNHVKKPCSAYGMFLRERKDIIKQENPKLKMADVLKLVSQEWKGLTEEQKNAYKGQASVEKEAARNRLAEALIRDKASKNGVVVPQATKGKKKVKKDTDTVDQTDVDVKAEETATPSAAFVSNQANSDVWPRFDEQFSSTLPGISSLPLSIPSGNSDMQVKAEMPLDPERKPSILQLFPTTSLDLMLNSSLFMKKQDTSSGNDSSLLTLLNRQVQRPNELLVDILNFDINFDKMTSLSLLEPRNSISQFLNLQTKQNGQSRGRFLNDTIINVLDGDGLKDCLFEEPATAISIEKKNP